MRSRCAPLASACARRVRSVPVTAPAQTGRRELVSSVPPQNLTETETETLAAPRGAGVGVGAARGARGACGGCECAPPRRDGL